MARPGLLAAFVLIFTPPALAAEPTVSGTNEFAVREYGDWSVACDNARECTAVSVSRAYVKRIEGTDPGDYASPKLWLRRAAGRNVRPRIFVDTLTWGEARPLGALSLHVYHDCDGDCTGRGYRISPIEPGRYELEPRQVDRFLAESAKTGRAATRRGDGTMHGILTTDGLIAAMRHMDGAAASGPPRPLVTVVGGEEEPIPEAYDHTALHRIRAAHCEIFGSTSAEPAPQRFRLATGQRLWSVGCNSNPHFEKRLWLIETGEGRFELFKLPRPDQGQAADLPILPNSDFDTATGRLTGFAGMACGWRRSWAWTASGFAMVDAVEMPACIDILPQRWLQTYRAVPQ